jgi:hypothetical protein
MHKLHSIPAEMKEFRQYVMWRYENRGTEKLTKVPYTAQGNLASINNINDWCGFDQALEALPNFDGIGFVLTLIDPYCFVDFDRSDDPQIVQNQINLHSSLDTYSEVSPGGGLHVICKASVPAGRRRDCIEVYSSARFMTMTGNIYANKEIAFRQTAISELWTSLEGTNANLAFAAHSVPATSTDLDIYNQASSATNGQKFLDLWNGDIHTYHYGDHSRADFALVDIIAFYTQNREQINRMFLASGLGQRDKAKRVDYRETMITRAFDKLIPSVDISGLMTKIDSFLEENKTIDLTPVVQHHAELVPASVNVKLQPERTIGTTSDEQNETFQPPPGLAGEIAEFIYKSAWKPVPQIATMGALGLMAGLAGRAYNASGSGLNLYLLLLAKTGRGKEAISKAYEKIFDAIIPLMPTIGDFSGPADLASGQALLRYMSDHNTKSFVSVFGEFGPMLKRITSPTAIGADLMTQKVMLDMYSKSGKSGKIMPTAYSDAERNTKVIYSPGFSFIAESAPQWFDDHVDLGMIATGLLPRFIIAEYDGIRVPSNEDGPLMQPGQKLVQGLMAVATQAMTFFQQNVVMDITFDSTALTKSRTLDKMCDERINKSTDEIISELWNRVHLNTIRIAGLIAVGKNPYTPVIDGQCWDWAERFIIYNIGKLEEKFSTGIMLSVNDSANEFIETERVEEAIIEYLIKDYDKLKSYGVTEDLHRCRVIPFSFFQRRLTRLKPFINAKIGAVNSIKRALQNLLDNGDLQEISKPQAIKTYDYHGRCFAIRSNRILDKAKSQVRVD